MTSLGVLAATFMFIFFLVQVVVKVVFKVTEGFMTHRFVMLALLSLLLVLLRFLHFMSRLFFLILVLLVIVLVLVLVFLFLFLRLLVLGLLVFFCLSSFLSYVAQAKHLLHLRYLL